MWPEVEVILQTHAMGRCKQVLVILQGEGLVLRTSLMGWGPWTPALPKAPLSWTSQPLLLPSAQLRTTGQMSQKAPQTAL